MEKKEKHGPFIGKEDPVLNVSVSILIGNVHRLGEMFEVIGDEETPKTSTPVVLPENPISDDDINTTAITAKMTKSSNWGN